MCSVNMNNLLLLGLLQLLAVPALSVSLHFDSVCQFINQYLSMHTCVLCTLCSG